MPAVGATGPAEAGSGVAGSGLPGSGMPGSGVPGRATAGPVEVAGEKCGCINDVQPRDNYDIFYRWWVRGAGPPLVPHALAALSNFKT